MENNQPVKIEFGEDNKGVTLRRNQSARLHTQTRSSLLVPLSLQRKTSLGREKASLQNMLQSLASPYPLGQMGSDVVGSKDTFVDFQNSGKLRPTSRLSIKHQATLTKLDYVAVKTRDPRQFKELGLNDTIRFKDDIKLCIVITFYNEPAEEVLLTIRGICESLKSLNEKFLDPNYWKHVCVVLLADGRAKLDQSTADLLELAGIYDESLLDLSEDTGMHMFQSLPVFTDDPWTGSTYPPLQTILMLKEKNQGKISSHWWFFEANCAAMNPQYCVMFDVGTKPLRNTLFSIYRCFERNSQITGISGELFCREVGNWNPIIAGQQIDYKFGTIMDRATESITGYLSVLPGCLSAYRWSDLQGAPLRVYFETLENPNRKWTVFESLVNLADDRLLCLELFCLPNRNATLHYLKDAVAESDVCMNLAELMKQRRRWINSAIAALVYMISKYHRIWVHPHHSIGRKLGALLIMAYYSFLSFFTFISVGVFVLFIDINMVHILEFSSVAVIVFRALFYSSVLLQIYTGFTSLDVKKYEPLFYVIAAFYCLVFFPVVYNATVLTIQGSLFSGFGNLLFIGLMFNYGVFFVMGLFHGHLLTMVVSFPQYMMVLPIFSIIIPIYCITNLHDLTWGTKSADKMSEEELKRKSEFVNFRNIAFLIWFILNAAVLAGGLYTYYTTDDIYNSPFGFFNIFVYITLFWVGWRFTAGCLVVLFHTYHKRLERKQHEDEVNRNLKARGDSLKVSLIETVYIHPILNGPISFLMILFKWTTYLSLLNVLFLSPLFCIVSLALFFGTVMLALPFILLALFFWIIKPVCGSFAKILMEFFTDIVACIGILWRYLATIEFSYNSFDGYIAQMIGVEKEKKSGTGKLFVVNAWTSPYDDGDPDDSFFRHIFSLEFTWRSLLYVIYIKPLSAFGGLAAALCGLAVPAYFFAKDLKDLIENDSILWVKLIPSYAAYILGAISLFPAFWLVWYLDKNMRLITCWALATHVMELDPTSDPEKI